jgi:hypothetical protein
MLLVQAACQDVVLLGVNASLLSRSYYLLPQAVV